ncbi:unnamed protein product [Moneuplotes crassus]|uniref:Uncharacterized protein n=1 Tax=Euplotes crassus TaxID=5936 RepID=A0AAD1Y7C1_EUPCR|nr:unnamed protein product [Moneuplotes crassus]
MKLLYKEVLILEDEMCSSECALTFSYVNCIGEEFYMTSLLSIYFSRSVLTEKMVASISFSYLQYHLLQPCTLSSFCIKMILEYLVPWQYVPSCKNT